MGSLEIHQLCYQIPSRKGPRRLALRNISIRVNEGECLSLVGSSGSGKTTLLRLIAGLIQPDAGRIAVDGRTVTGLAPKQRGISMVFQGLALYPHLTVRQNLELGLRFRGIPQPERERKISEMVDRFHLQAHVEQYPAALSGGEQQRVALGRALLQSPKVILLDEPMSDLDLPLRTILRPELRRISREWNLAMLYVTHDQADAMAMGDRLALIREGVIEECGTSRELYQNPVNLFTARFLGAHPPNVLSGAIRIRAGEWLLELPSIKWWLRLKPKQDEPCADHSSIAQDVTVIVRPEDIGVVEEDAAGFVAQRGIAEYRGHEQIGELVVGEELLRCVIPSSTPWNAGEHVRGRLNPRGVFIFSTETGKRINAQPMA